MTTTKFDKAVGRYVHLTIDDVEYRVYYEESGSGIPLLLQHTAGCDGRQIVISSRTRRSPRTSV